VSLQYVVIAVLIAAAIVGIVRFETFCISDLNRTPDGDLLFLTRAGWFTAILLVIPIGGVAYLYCGKVR
jgi:hypothetical protein